MHYLSSVPLTSAFEILTLKSEVAQFWAPPPRTSYKHQFYDVMNGFTRLIMKTKYVCHGPISRLFFLPPPPPANFEEKEPISPHAIFLVNRLVGTVILIVEKLQVGGKGKRAQFCSVVKLSLASQNSAFFEIKN